MVKGGRLRFLKNLDIIYEDLHTKTIVLQYDETCKNGMNRVTYYTAMKLNSRTCFLKRASKDNEYVKRAIKKNGN